MAVASHAYRTRFPIKTLDTLLAWRVSVTGKIVSVATHCCWEKQALSTQLLWETQLEAQAWSLLDPALYVPLPSADFNLYSFAIMSHDYEYSSSAEFCKSFFVNRGT